MALRKLSRAALLKTAGCIQGNLKVHSWFESQAANFFQRPGAKPRSDLPPENAIGRALSYSARAVTTGRAALR